MATRAQDIIDVAIGRLYCSRGCGLSDGASPYNLELAGPARLRELAKQMTGESLERTFGATCESCRRPFAFFPETGT